MDEATDMARIELGLPPDSTPFHLKCGGLLQNLRKRLATALD